MVYGYARVSTIGQSRDCNSLLDQRQQLAQYGCDEIIEESCSGKNMDRPQLNSLLERIGSGDTLVVTKLDRFARTVIDGVQTITDLLSRGVTVHIVNMGRIDNTLTGRLILTVMLAFAEFERGMIIERTQAGKQAAKQDPSFRDGRPPKFGREQIRHALELIDSGKTFRQVEAMTGISKSTLIRARRRRIPQ